MFFYSKDFITKYLDQARAERTIERCNLCDTIKLESSDAKNNVRLATSSGLPLRDCIHTPTYSIILCMEAIDKELTQTGEDQFDQNLKELNGSNTNSSTVACTGDCSSASCGGSRACD